MELLEWISKNEKSINWSSLTVRKLIFDQILTIIYRHRDEL